MDGCLAWIQVRGKPDNTKTSRTRPHARCSGATAQRFVGYWTLVVPKVVFVVAWRERELEPDLEIDFDARTMYPKLWWNKG
ncbi:hypothetical protein E5D57_008825 [Metarhizium anisopliae]|nr:hypothetical protein E5D57_008825 [Metarhizium anisopliae]